MMGILKLRKGNWIVFLCFCYFTHNPLFSQSPNASFRNITSADGLPSTGIRSVTQDAFGYIWIGTWDYVYRYDGNKFKKIRNTDEGRKVHGDSKGGVWITFSESVGYYNSYADSVTKYNIPNAQRFGDLVTDAANHVWVSTNDRVVRLDTASNLFIVEPGQRHGPTSKLKACGNGELIFLFLDNKTSLLMGRRSTKGVYSYEQLPFDLNSPEKETRFGHTLNVEEFGVHPLDSTGLLIVNGYGWAHRKWNETVWTYHKGWSNVLAERPNDLILDGLGNMWLSQTNALTKINIVTGKSTLYSHNPTNPRSILPMNSNRYLFFDRQGVLWIAHFGTGISRLNLFESDFGLLKDSANAPVLDVISALELKDGSYWIGSRRTDGLTHYDSNGSIIKRYTSHSFDSPPGRTVSNELSNPFPHSLAVSADGSVWVGTGSIGNHRGGLNRIRPGSNLITRFKNDPNDKSSLASDFINTLLVDGSDRVWAFSYGGISIIDPATEKIMTEFNIETTDTSQNTVRKDNPKTFSHIYFPHLVTSSGDVLVTTNEHKHFIIDHKTLQSKPFAPEIASADSMRFIQQDDEGKIWFSSLKGFGYLNSTFTAVDHFYDFDKLNLPIDEIPGLFSDKRGHVWLTTDNGIFEFEPASQTYKHFSFERGLHGNLFDIDSYKGPSGKMYFHGTSGINIFNPEDIHTNPYPPQMAFTGLKLDGKSIVFGQNAALQKPIFVADRITVGPEIVVIAVDFAALHFASNKDNQYQYKLDGFDKNWRDGGTIGNATYTNLSPGDYTLFVKGSNLDNVWSDGNKSIAITILPPWWRTWWAFAGYGLIFLFMIIRVHLYQQTITIRNERARVHQKELEQAKEMEKAYHELKSTQQQLIQSEKMASLGELTAGIAHEIQNPLNFVNNFSEVNEELLAEMKDELDKGNIEDAKAIANDAIENQQKILHHGKRADAIVKGMLQHSRTSSGVKEPTDINALADEYLRLAYHGLRAKDKSFNAKFETNLDPTLPKVNIIPQDIGRVILNLITNAFYAVNERANNQQRTTINESYEPTVTVTTKKSGNKIEIRVKDNGNGIPQKVLDKIFQPFFTTKPTGQGTGLGLSLSYDIVKAHGGELKVETIENIGSEFIIGLSINS